MEVKIIELTLLNHLFYYTEVAGGNTSSTVTGDFIGDLALTYAFSKAIIANDTYYQYRTKPDYNDIEGFGFYCSVARPKELHRLTEAYIQNTLFNVDGYIDVKAIEKSGKSPFKNFRQVQGVRLGSKFLAILFSKAKMELPPIIRIGRSLETMVQVKEVNSKEVENDFWLNAFSLKTIFNNLDPLIEILVRESKVNFSFVLENYNIIKNVKREEAMEIFKKQFDG